MKDIDDVIATRSKQHVIYHTLFYHSLHIYIIYTWYIYTYRLYLSICEQGIAVKVGGMKVISAVHACSHFFDDFFDNKSEQKN